MIKEHSGNMPCKCKKRRKIDPNEKITAENYEVYVAAHTPRTSYFKTLSLAFFIGGFICTFGQVLIESFVLLGATRGAASAYASCSLIVIASVLTGFGVYDKFGRFAGAGSTIPITGFSNAMTSPALEFRSEGLIYGLGAKMFTITGPVIANGVLLSVLVALFMLIFGL